MGDVVAMPKYEVYNFLWGSAVKDRKGKWIKVFIGPDGQELNTEEINIEVHENGIEFIDCSKGR